MPSPEVVGGKRSVHVDTPAAGRDPTPGGAPCKRQRPVDRLDPAAGQQEAVAGQHGGVAGQQEEPPEQQEAPAAVQNEAAQEADVWMRRSETRQAGVKLSDRVCQRFPNNNQWLTWEMYELENTVYEMSTLLTETQATATSATPDKIIKELRSKVTFLQWKVDGLHEAVKSVQKEAELERQRVEMACQADQAGAIFQRGLSPMHVRMLQGRYDVDCYDLVRQLSSTDPPPSPPAAAPTDATNHRQPASQPAAMQSDLRSHDSAAEFSEFRSIDYFIM
eukprot:COSAG01_NODE_1362_length_10565_cov_111.342156_2_plen_277_part_00